MRVARGLMPLHELGVPHGRVNAEAVLCDAPPCAGRGMLLDADEVRRSYAFYSAMRCKLSGSSIEDDVWALGVLLYHAVTGAYPFPGKHRRAVRERIDWRPASPISVYDVEHPRLQSLLDRLFKPDEVLRLVTIDQLIDSLMVIDGSLAELPALEFGVETGDEVSAVLRDPARTAAQAAQLERTVERVRRELDADEEARVLERLVDGIEREQGADRGKGAPFVADRASDDAIVLDASDIEPLEEDLEVPVDLLSDSYSMPAEVPADLVLPSSLRPHQQRAAREIKKRGVGPFVAVGLLAIALAAAGSYYYLFVYARTTAPDPSALRPQPAPSSSAAPSPTSERSLAPPAFAAPGDDVTSCVTSMFDPGTFEASTPRLDFLCSEPNPRRAADALKTEIVLGKGTRATTAAMQRWSRLGWYELAFVAMARSRCCGEPSAFETMLGGAPCFFDRELTALGEASVRGDEHAFRVAMGSYAKSIDCLARAGSSRLYGQAGAPAGGEAEAFADTIRAVRSTVGGGEELDETEPSEAADAGREAGP